MGKRLAAWLGSGVLLAAIFLMGLSYYIGSKLIAPHPVVMPAHPELPFENVTLSTATQAPVYGWWLQKSSDAPAVLLLHSVRSSRLEMIPRAKALYDRGYSVLLIDLPSHGESPGNAITFGFREAAGVNSAWHWLYQRVPGSKIGVIGISQGGAALLMSDVRGKFDAVVLEMVYPTLQQAVHNRVAIRTGDALASVITPLLTLQLKPRLGFSADALRPVDHINQLGAPLLIVAGADDRHTPLIELQQMLARAHPPKSIWVLPGVHHQDTFAHDPDAWKRHVIDFLDHTLRGNLKHQH
ncbi:alpha/beta hydrolase [Superficieibacter electus]|uniref:Alpha/beta hydrolase n=1 Tax=Superficieibacter electus TaxID=2022662 RepID=A0A2P5GSF0_9ENTR|nr:alpha/beta hydrolase [Superficieibacter electus]POP46762.1 alpha/beta hydrolase [Superficieibacter electus]POP49500.1 alpha/beta hydrolase [Superficieibacter electus]